MSKVLAITTDGKMTYCACDPSQRGKGRCNHVLHQNSDENEEDFCSRLEFFSQHKEDIPNVLESIQRYEGCIDGALTKFKSNNFYYKTDSESEMFEQRNALSEEMACLVESEIEGFDYVDYSVVNLQDSKTGKSFIACKSENFLQEGEEFKTINQEINFGDEFLIDDFDEPVDRNAQLSIVVRELHASTGLPEDEIKSSILRQISADFLFMNGDRTLNNMGIIYDEHTGKAKRMASCFDNGSCVPAYKEYDDASIEDIEEEFNICTFGIGDNEDYIDMIKANGGPFLKINSKRLIEKIKNYECKAYPKRIVERNKKILIRNIKKYKGVLYYEEE